MSRRTITSKMRIDWQLLFVVMPVVMFFSYYPVMRLGGNETMNFELSLPLIYLVVFDVVGTVVAVSSGYCRKLDWMKGWGMLLFPVFVICSVMWSENVLRGALTAGVVGLIVVAVILIVMMRDAIDVRVREWFMKVFWWGALVVSAWCVVQCVLDVMGVAQEYTLMCDGCTYRMFGFPRPDGFAIEPQFMGNLMLAPVLMCIYNMDRKKMALMTVFAFTLFLTMSRGAIYAMVVAIIFWGAYRVARGWKAELRQEIKRVFSVYGVMIVAFLLSLNMQGMLAAVSPTDDTYATGVAKVINQLTLGMVDVQGKSDDDASLSTEDGEMSEVHEVDGGGLPDNRSAESEKEEAVFDGYVEESTDTRLRLTGDAIRVWREDFKNVMVGVGIGGAGQALYDVGLTPAPKEIVQNEYASLLLETGIVGIILLIVMVLLATRYVAMHEKSGVILSLMVAYGVGFVFFSGIPNAIHTILLPAALLMICECLDKWAKRGR